MSTVKRLKPVSAVDAVRPHDPGAGVFRRAAVERALHTGRVSYRTSRRRSRTLRFLNSSRRSRKLADSEVDVIVFAATAPTLA